MNIELPLTAKCSDCGYLLRGLQDPRCPECGKPFVPSDPSTYQLENRSWLREFYGRPPGRLHLTTVCVATVYALVEASAPGGMLGFLFICALVPAASLAILLIGQDYICRLVAHAYRRDESNKESLPTHLISRIRWIATPICALLIGSMILYPWPGWMRFKLSQSAFEQVVRDYQADTLPDGAQWVGLYHVGRVAQQGSGHLFFITGDSGHGDLGFVFQTSNLSPEGQLYFLHQLAPRWFIAHQNW